MNPGLKNTVKAKLQSYRKRDNLKVLIHFYINVRQNMKTSSNSLDQTIIFLDGSLKILGQLINVLGFLAQAG